MWEFLWNNIKQADIFITYPRSQYLPRNIPKAKVAYMPASTDPLDGLNKDISEWDQGYYRALYNKECALSSMPQLCTKRYIIQITRFTAEDIDDTFKAYSKFIQLLKERDIRTEVPLLVITGYLFINDPESNRVYNQSMYRLEKDYPHLVPFVSVTRIDANIQLLNSLLSGSHILLQLSTENGFEIRISEALRKGKPVIATKTGGIPLQVHDKKNGFLIDAGDWNAVARHMFDLSIDDELYEKMSQSAKSSLSDDLSAVGNAMSWFYLSNKLYHGEAMVPDGRSVNDLARNEAGKLNTDGDIKLPR